MVGIGPGSSDQCTIAAKRAIEKSDIIVGYRTYIRLLEQYTIGKTIDVSGMRDERDRVNRAIDYSNRGNTVTLISSGNPGVYGMAGLVFELCKNRKIVCNIMIVPGVTAANSAAALLGAPLSCDYCVVSLSDILVPKERILKRIKGAASADLVTVLYNPVSKKRKQIILDVQKIFMEHKKPDTPVGIVRNIAREGEEVVIASLDTFTKQKLDMVTTIIIGNSQTIT